MMGLVRLWNLYQLPIHRNYIGFRIDARSKFPHHSSIDGHPSSHDHIFCRPQCSNSCTCQYFV